MSPYHDFKGEIRDQLCQNCLSSFQNTIAKDWKTYRRVVAMFSFLHFLKLFFDALNLNNKKFKFRRKSFDSNFYRLFCLIFCMPLATAETYGKAGGHPPRVVDSEVTTRSAFVGQTVTLHCMVSGNPFPETAWSKDGEQIGADWSRIKQKRTSLRIRNLQTVDSGFYVCEAVNGYGVREVKIRLIVHDHHSTNKRRKNELVKPTFSQPIKMRQNNYVKPQGGSVSFRCKARGKPKPRISWFKDRNATELTHSGGNGRPQWTLTLRDIQVEDSGRYTCRVWNSEGEISFRYTLRVLGSTSHDRPVILKPHPLNTTVKAGEKASLQCKVRSVVPPTVKWIKRLDQASVDSFNGKWPNNSLKIDEKLYLILPPQQMMTLPDGSYLNKLIINEAKVQDSGMYICLGANTMGYNFRYAYLTVTSDGRVHAKNVQVLPPRDWIIGVSSAIALILVMLLALQWVRRSKAKSKKSPSACGSTQSYDDASPSQADASRIDHVTVEAGSMQVRSGATVQMVHSNGKIDYINPLHSQRRSDIGRQSRHSLLCNPLADATDSDVGANRVFPPPPPPPSQYSRSSSCRSSSRHSAGRSHHYCIHKYHAPPPSQHSSHIYEDF